MMTLKPYTVVQLLSDQYSDRGVPVGAVGTILEIYGNEAYEVEFSREDGTTIAWFAVPQSEVISYTDSSLALERRESA
jgi:Domain of unknown function (DUF4926)